MITTVCMNPSFDKTATVEHLIPGDMNRLENPRLDIGGKGINVALVLKRLGEDVQCLSCMGSENRAFFLGLLAEAGLSHDCISVEGRIRTNLKVYDKVARNITELNEAGITLQEEDLARFLDLLCAKTKDSEYVIFGGSLPGGCSSKTYQKCLSVLPEKKKILDAEGEALLYGIQEKPFLVKPNLSEMEGIMKKELRTLRSLRDAAHFLMQYGAENVVISMGKYGAMLVMSNAAYFAPALSVETKSTVGAGDCMIGGMVHGLVHGAGLVEAFRHGVAAGAASVMTEGTQPFEPNVYEALLPKVVVQEV